MTPIVENILWCFAGVIGSLIIIKLIKKRPDPTELTRENSDSITQENSDSISLNEQNNGVRNPEPKVWEPAEIAVTRHLEEIKPLLMGVSKTKISNEQQWTEVVVAINNDDLTEMWRSAVKRPELWVTYLQTFGLQSDLVSEFICLPEYRNMYSLKEGTMEDGKKYKVISPCWIYTDTNNEQHLALKGVVQEMK